MQSISGGWRDISGVRAALGRMNLGAAALVGASVACVVVLGACKQEAPPPPPPAANSQSTAPTPPPPPPVDLEPEAEPVQVQKLIAEVKPDARVQFPQEVAPRDASIARAVLQASSALAKGEDDKLRAMLSSDAQPTLDGLVNSGDWETATKKIEGVTIVGLRQEPSTSAQAKAFTVQMAVQEPGEAYVIAWEGVREGAGWKLTGARAPSGTRPRASDWIGADLSGPSGRSGARGQDGAAGAATGAGAGGDVASMLAAMPDEMKVTQGVMILLAQKWAKDDGKDLQQLMSEAGQSLPPGFDTKVFDELGTQAKALVARGVMPEKASFKMLVDALSMQPGKGKDKVFADLASVTGTSEDTWRKLYGDDAGGSSGGGRPSRSGG